MIDMLQEVEMTRHAVRQVSPRDLDLGTIMGNLVKSSQDLLRDC